MLNWEKAREYKKEDLLESLSTWKKWNKILNEIGTPANENIISILRCIWDTPSEIKKLLEL